MQVKLCIHLLQFLGHFQFKSKNYCLCEVPFSIKSKPHSSAQKASAIKELSRVFNRASHVVSVFVPMEQIDLVPSVPYS